MTGVRPSGVLVSVGGDLRWPGRLAALARKYRALAALASERDAREAAGVGLFSPAEAGARRGAMRGLARRFPGALRELDRVPAPALAARAAATASAAARLLADPEAPIPVELALAAAYHRDLRRALRRRRWLAERASGPADDGPHADPAGGPRRSVDAGGAPSPAAIAAFARRFSVPPGEAAALAARLLRPPGGRLGAAVLAEVAARFALGAGEAARLLFAPPDGNPASGAAR